VAQDELKVCPKCGWNDLQYAGHSCDPEAGATADALMAAVPEAESSKFGYGTGHVVLGYGLDGHDFVLKFQADNGTLRWRDISCFMHDLTVEQAADLVRTLLAWRRRL
jgi:predicted  nucleic acid-binding Zn-ribbon protein